MRQRWWHALHHTVSGWDRNPPSLGQRCRADGCERRYPLLRVSSCACRGLSNMEAQAGTFYSASVSAGLLCVTIPGDSTPLMRLVLTFPGRGYTLTCSYYKRWGSSCGHPNPQPIQGSPSCEEVFDVCVLLCATHGSAALEPPPNWIKNFPRSPSTRLRGSGCQCFRIRAGPCLEPVARGRRPAVIAALKLDVHAAGSDGGGTDAFGRNIARVGGFGTLAALILSQRCIQERK